MKKWVSIFMLCLCLCLVPGALANSFQIPATSQEALNQLPMSLPPLPEITVDSTSYSQGTAFVISGLDAWPLEHIKNYQSGVFLYGSMGIDGLTPIKGLEEEPFAIIMPEDISTVNFVLKKSKLKDFQITLDEKEVQFRLIFSNEASCEIRPNGILSWYSFTSKEVTVFAHYNEDGLLRSYNYEKLKWENGCGYIQLNVVYNPLGDISYLFLRDEPDTRYSYYDGQWFCKNVPGIGSFSCEKPKGFSFDTYPPAILYPTEDAAEIAESYKSSLMARDPLFSISEDLKRGLDPNTLFPPLPKILKEADGSGNLILSITGLSAWGVNALRPQYWVGAGAQLLPVEHPDDEIKIRIAWDSLSDPLILTLPFDNLSIYNLNVAYTNFISFEKFSAEDWRLDMYLDNGSFYSFSMGYTPYLRYYECFKNGKVYSYEFRSGNVWYAVN